MEHTCPRMLHNCIKVERVGRSYLLLPDPIWTYPQRTTWSRTPMGIAKPNSDHLRLRLQLPLSATLHWKLPSHHIGEGKQETSPPYKLPPQTNPARRAIPQSKTVNSRAPHNYLGTRHRQGKCRHLLVDGRRIRKISKWFRIRWSRTAWPRPHLKRACPRNHRPIGSNEQFTISW